MRRVFSLLIAVLLIATNPGISLAVDLQPHRAVYRMVLANAARHSDVVSANGIMVYRVVRVCDGWTVENRTFLRLLYDNDTQADTLWSFASWESTDGRKFRFHARYDQDGKTIEKLEGDAELPAGNAEGSAHFTQPERVMTLPAGTLFPTEHVRRLIAAAQSGQHVLSRTVFDGASLDNPYSVNALFGPLSVTAADQLAANLHIPSQPAWWTRMAFFPLGSLEAEPEFEMAADYRADGIADRIIQYFDSFSLDVRVKEIELLPPPDC